MKVEHTTLNFKAGLTSKMRQEIASTDVVKISREFFNHGIETDFKNNKVIAWCSLQCLKLIKFMNEKYGLNLGIPKGIFVEDFNKLKIAEKEATGFLNFAPAKLYLGDDKIIPEKTIFFNEFEGFNYSGGNEFWNRIDRMSDENFDRRFSSTDFFLEPVLHEFLHAVHEDNLIRKLGGKRVVKILESALSPLHLEVFRAKYDRLLEPICTYASTTPFEAVACDFSKRTIENLDKTTLLPQSNFIRKSPYKKQNFLEYHLIYKPESKLTQTLRRFWNGKME